MEMKRGNQIEYIIFQKRKKRFEIKFCSRRTSLTLPCAAASLSRAPPRASPRVARIGSSSRLLPQQQAAAAHPAAPPRPQPRAACAPGPPPSLAGRLRASRGPTPPREREREKFGGDCVRGRGNLGKGKFGEKINVFLPLS